MTKRPGVPPDFWNKILKSDFIREKQDQTHDQEVYRGGADDAKGAALRCLVSYAAAAVDVDARRKLVDQLEALCEEHGIHGLLYSATSSPDADAMEPLPTVRVLVIMACAAGSPKLKLAAELGAMREAVLDEDCARCGGVYGGAHIY